jgi:ornithine cyclodeaminase/alanine dehydrogenase-like protein (mu-crystallin family)
LQDGRFWIREWPNSASTGELTLFKSLGIALEDVAFRELIYRRAIEAGVGRVLERATGRS